MFRKRTNSNEQMPIENIDAKVYIGNVPTDRLTDQEFLTFFKPFGNIIDIRVCKGYLFVQYEHINDAKRLIKEGEKCLYLKGNKLDVSPAMDRTSSHHQRYSTDYQPPRKRFPYQMDLDHSIERTERVDCRILLVNPRQKEYVEQINSHLRSHGLTTSTILLRTNSILTQAIENAKHERCLYAIIVMPYHQQQNKASFYILQGKTEEHRNIPLKDGYNILLNNYSSQKKNFFSNFNEKLPLPMLLCLLADGRQLTLDEIDRILIYLFEKKSNMLTLPSGTFPPLPSLHTQTSNSSSNINEQIQQLFKNSSNHSFQKEINKSSEQCQSLTPSLPNSAAADAAAAIFQAYSLFNQRNN